MTRTFRIDRQKSRNVFDRFYHSFSAEFWLITASAIIIFDWCLHPSSSTAAFLMLATVSLGGFALCSTNPRIGRTASDFLRKHGKSGVWLMFVGLLVGITVFNYATSPSSALILTNSGISVLTTILSGGAAGGAASPAAGILNNVILVFRVLFFLGFMWALYRAYDKYSQQAELLDVIQTPVVLLIVVGIIDAAAGIFLATPAP
ncbi:hypothetical protein [Chamaesiphon polymorphus]|uniref:Uncharacterized protein n=1 Tax=Chamaesiphon polymorphus CCALA 037 TaxID=2107692 RepID=A0A2T1GHJ9_9CYAN|nr:hypothetical protein [Chamaesiphon polymorphus]PSB57068.1 hypothetical protein C7B77_09730 [Chamaesiphon polymorphus CCALA 037]